MGNRCFRSNVAPNRASHENLGKAGQEPQHAMPAILAADLKDNAYVFIAAHTISSRPDDTVCCIDALAHRVQKSCCDDTLPASLLVSASTHDIMMCKVSNPIAGPNDSALGCAIR